MKFFHGTDQIGNMEETDETSLSLWTPVLINNKPPQLCFEALINRKRVENHVNKFYRTEPIDIRLGENLVRLKNGETCRLIGDLYDPKACVPYDVKMKFRRGIPQNWSDVVQGWAKMLETDHLEILALSNYSQKKRLWTILKSLGILKVSAKGRIIFPTWKYCTGNELKINNLLCNPASGNICIPKLMHKLEKELSLKIASKDSISKDSSIKKSISDSNLLLDKNIKLQPIPDNSRVSNMELTSESNLRRTRRIDHNHLVKKVNSKQNSSSSKMEPHYNNTVAPKNSNYINSMKHSSRSISPRKQETHYSNVNRRKQSLCSEKSVACVVETRNTKRREMQTLNTECKVQSKVRKSRAKQIKNKKNSNPKNKNFMVKCTAADYVVSKCIIESTGSVSLHRATKNAVELMRSAETVVTRRHDEEIKQNVPENLQSKSRERKVNQLLRFSKLLTKENNDKNGKNPSSVKKVTDFTSRKASKYIPYELKRKALRDTKTTSYGIGSKIICGKKTEKKVESKKQIQRNDNLSVDKRKAEKISSVQMKKLKANKISRLRNRVANKVTSQKMKNSNASSLKRKSKEYLNDGISSVLSPRGGGHINSKSSVQQSVSEKKRTSNVAEREFVDLHIGLVGPPKTLSDRKKLKQSINRLSSSFVQPMDLFSDPHYHHLIEDAENASNQEWDTDYLIALEQVKNGSQGDQLSVGSATPPQKYILDSITNEPQIIRGTSPFDNSSPNQEEVVRYIHRQMKQKNKFSKEKSSRTKLCTLNLPSLDDQNAQELSETAYNAMLSGKQMPRKLFDLKYRRRSDSDSSESSEY